MTTIAQERSALSKVPGFLRPRRREEWGSTFSYTSRFTVSEPATRVFIHITVTNPGNYRSNDAHARAIEAIGRSRFPNTGISYNRLIMPDGSLYEGQPIGRQGAHTVNNYQRRTCTTSGCPGRGVTDGLTAPSWNLNVNARAYVICQNVNDPVSDKQVDTIARAIVADYKADFITRAAAHNFHGHRCVSSKSCPGDKMWAKMGLLHTKVHFYLDNGLGKVSEPTTPPVEAMAMSLYGLKKGDKGGEVKILQIILGYAGFPRAGGVQTSAVYDTATSNAVLAMRKAMGSSATSGDVMDTYATGQLFRALARAEAQRVALTSAQLSSAVSKYLADNAEKFRGPAGRAPTQVEIDAAAAQFATLWLESNKDELKGPPGVAVGQVVQITATE